MTARTSSLYLQDFVLSQTTRPLLSPSACQDEAGTLGPLGGANSPLARGPVLGRSCGASGTRRSVAGAGLTAESTVQRQWRGFSGSTAFSHSGAMGRQRLGPNGSDGGETAEKPTPGTKAHTQSQTPSILFLSLCYFFHLTVFTYVTTTNPSTQSALPLTYSSLVQSKHDFII